MGHYKNLTVWQKSIDLVVAVYALIEGLPDYEKYALADQLRRAVVSIPSNIAEGQRRASFKEVVQFTSIALGSTAEVETQLYIVDKLYDIDVSRELELCAEIDRMLVALVKKLRAL